MARTFAINAKPAFVWVHSERGGLLGHFVHRRVLSWSALYAVALPVEVLFRAIDSKQGESEYTINILHEYFLIYIDGEGWDKPYIDFFFNSDAESRQKI
jgi:hypothetical protein